MPSDILDHIKEFVGGDSQNIGSGPATVLAILDDDDGALTPRISVEDNLNGAQGNSEDAAFSKQLANLRTFTDSVPFRCESPEEMEVKLAQIVDNIIICTKADHARMLKAWNAMLTQWTILRYPFAKATRIKLINYYYEFCLVPGTPLHMITERSQMLQRILPRKHDHLVKLDTDDLVLDWRPLWHALKKDLWPYKRIHDYRQNAGNLYLHIAEECRNYFHKAEVKNILNTMLPFLNKETHLSMIPVLVSFLPLYRPQDYIQPLFSIWEAFNSNVVDEKLIYFMGNLAEEHVTGFTASYGEEGAAPWLDVGIWSEAQWAFLMAKCLGQMHIPIGAIKGASTTAGEADKLVQTSTTRLKNPVNKMASLAKLVVYSMSVDGHERSSTANEEPQETSFLAGSRALDSLAKIITSAESFFHPSNTGLWTLGLSGFLHHLASEFCKRWKEEEDRHCKTPIQRRLTTTIRREFVLTLRTPLLLSLFGKDPVSIGFAQGALKSIAMLEPGMIVPQVLERAYSGLEVVNETHRTTAVLSMLVGIAQPLLSEKIWLGGQRHIVPLLDLCLPGIDLNDPAKTVCTTAFICAVAQYIKIGELRPESIKPLASVDVPMEDVSVVLNEKEDDTFGSDRYAAVVKEREAVRESTAGFADWVTMLFRRVFALYENLPEEGGKKNMTGGKAEETMLNSIRATLDIVCLHLSDELFDLVLRLVFDYATTNAKANAVRAFGTLVSCLARANPEKTIEKFLPFCASQIEEELKHGASSVRTTSSHAAIPSDTTLHWNIAILRGCLGYGGPALLKHRKAILDLLVLLTEKTKSERGYSGSGRLITRLLHTLSGIYPINSRFVNSEEWETEEFDRNHNVHWGRMYLAKDVKVEWHVPSDDEIAFVLEILEKVADPLLTRLEGITENTKWQQAERNDFCRFLYAVRSVWGGIPTLIQEPKKKEDLASDGEDDIDRELFPEQLSVEAGFALVDPADPRFIAVMKYRAHFGHVIHKAAVTLRGGNDEGEDHIDAIIGALRAIDIYLNEYGTNHGSHVSMQKAYIVSRDNNRMWPKQKENTRHVFLKRAQLYHIGRLVGHAGGRRRSEFDSLLCDDLLEFALSPYTRVRRQSQHALTYVVEYYPLSVRSFLPKLMAALRRDSDADRMKGALYTLSRPCFLTEAYFDRSVMKEYLTTLLECQHQEKPSIQQLVATVFRDLTTTYLNEAGSRNQMTFKSDTRFFECLDSLHAQYSHPHNGSELLERAIRGAKERQLRSQAAHKELIDKIVEISERSTTHWRYLQMALQFLLLLMRRDIPPDPRVANLFIKATTNSHMATRQIGQTGISKLLAYVKVRTFSKNNDDLWLEEWRHPLQRDIKVETPEEIRSFLEEPFSTSSASNKFKGLLVDKVKSGFLLWEPTLKAYSEPDVARPFSKAWEAESQPALAVIDNVLKEKTYFSTLMSLFSQESDTRLDRGSDLTLRKDNYSFIYSLAKTFENAHEQQILASIQPLLFDPDRYKQRAAAEVLLGLLRGSKHWIRTAREALWKWAMERMNSIFAQLKPDTMEFWESFFEELFRDIDPRRNKPLSDWILSLHLDFHSDSVFAMSKSLNIFTNLVSVAGDRFNAAAERYVNLFFENFDIGYAEIRSMIAQCLHLLMSLQWHPTYPSLDAFLESCATQNDPLRIREAPLIARMNAIVGKLPEWKRERLPPPRVNQSQYDKVALSMLSLLWAFGHTMHASTIFPYTIPAIPEILKMEELNDNTELLLYSSATLHLLSGVTPPREYIELVADQFITTIKTASSWKIKLHGLPILIVFFYRNLINFSEACIERLMDAVITCLGDENVEVREAAAKLLAGLLRCSQRSAILPLRQRFVTVVRNTRLPSRRDPSYADTLRKLHSSILGICSLIESFPYSVEPWMPPLTEVLAPHASDPPPISTTIRKCASEFKKTHQDTWATDQQAFDEDQQQALSSMLIGTSYYA